MGESRKNAFRIAIGRRSVSYHGFLPWAFPSSPLEMPWYETDRRGIAILRRVFSTLPRSGRKSKKRVLNRNWTTFGFIPGIFASGLGKAQGEMPWYETDRRGIAIPRVVFSTFAHRCAKVEITPLGTQLDDVRFHTTAFCPGLGKGPGRNAVVDETDLVELRS